MGKGNKKKFIAKGEGQHFYLLHRSQTDTAHLGEEPPSNFVLVKAEDRIESRQSGNAIPRIQLKATKDHINALGFRNDGYDYSQHLKEMGGGHFIGADGKVRDHLPSTNVVELPPDALPSGEEFQRGLEAITIGDEFMDEDLHAALFGEGNEEFEELDDDFVGQAMTAPETVDFDYEAHIASLIARSEGLVQNGGQKPRGWSDDEGSDVSSYDEGEHGTGHSTLPKDKAEMLHDIEEQFEKTLEEYADDAIGDLEDEVYDDDMQGNIELDGDNEMFLSAMDEFLQESKDHALAEGVTSYIKNSHAIGWVPGADDNVPVPSLKDEEVLRRMHEFTLESTSDIPQDEEESAITEKELGEMMTSQEYLREERQQEDWDCETILSTYSTLDNHPTMIQTDKSGKKKKLRRRRTGEEGGPDEDMSTTSSQLSRASLSNGRGGSRDAFFSKGALKTGGPTQQIVLGGKYMLPKKNQSSATASALSTMQAVVDRNILKKKQHDNSQSVASVQEEGSSGSGSGSENSSDEEDEGGEERVRLRREKKLSLRQKETPEEKKMRKAQVKEERRAKRNAKKQLKTAFRSEATRQAEVTGQRQDTDHVSVFRY